MNCAIIVAAGKGTRMGPDVDKLFLSISGRPVIAHTWERFDVNSSVDELVLVIRAGQEKAFREVADLIRPNKPFKLVAGGKERQDSVWNGLEALPANCKLVAIQDGARPCTSSELISGTFAAAAQHGAAVATQRVIDTIKESQNAQTITRHLDRSLLWAVQTPQTFKVEVIRRALSAVREKNLLVTDDTAACELIGQPVFLVEGKQPNPKVTLPSDIPLIELLLSTPN